MVIKKMEFVLYKKNNIGNNHLWNIKD